MWRRSRPSAPASAAGSSGRSDPPTPAQEHGWPAIASGRPRPHPGADRLGQDPRRVPLGARPRPARRGNAGPLRQPAQGTELRRRAKPARPARRDRLRALGRRPHRRHAAEGAGGNAESPPDILITTPESLFLMLTSQARETLRRPGRDRRRGARGRRLQARRAPRAEPRAPRVTRRRAVQRVGLSATQRPLEEIGRFVSGGRPIELVDAGTRKGSSTSGSSSRSRTCASPERGSIWPSIHRRSSTLVRHRSTIVFVNNRRLAERLASA